jgi:hypothetical protein
MTLGKLVALASLAVAPNLAAQVDSTQWAPIGDTLVNHYELATRSRQNDPSLLRVDTIRLRNRGPIVTYVYAGMGSFPWLETTYQLCGRYPSHPRVLVDRMRGVVYTAEKGIIVHRQPVETYFPEKELVVCDTRAHA